MKDIERVLKELKKTDAKIIWATTTPVNDKNIYCRNCDIDTYNRAATKLMEKQGVEINDLNGVVKADVGAFITNDHLHLSYQGRLACAEAVANAIAKYL